MAIPANSKHSNAQVLAEYEKLDPKKEVIHAIHIKNLFPSWFPQAYKQEEKRLKKEKKEAKIGEDAGQ